MLRQHELVVVTGNTPPKDDLLAANYAAQTVCGMGNYEVVLADQLGQYGQYSKPVDEIVGDERDAAVYTFPNTALRFAAEATHIVVAHRRKPKVYDWLLHPILHSQIRGLRRFAASKAIPVTDIAMTTQS